MLASWGHCGWASAYSIGSWRAALCPPATLPCVSTTAWWAACRRGQSGRRPQRDAPRRRAL